jgi:hypothetical protein
MVEKQLFYSYLGSNLAALIMLAFSWLENRWPPVCCCPSGPGYITF